MLHEALERTCESGYGNLSFFLFILACSILITMPWSGSVNFEILRRKTSVKLPIIFIKIKVGQMLPFSYISSLLVSILRYCI